MNTALMKLARFKSLAWPLMSCLVLAAMVEVQGAHVPGKVENSVRLASGLLGLVIVPTLLVLAIRDRSARQQRQLSRWRNGFGLGSIIVLSVMWAFYWGIALLTIAFSPTWLQSYGLDWTSFVLDSTLFGFLLAFFLQGLARSLTISAALLMWVGVISSFYV